MGWSTHHPADAFLPTCKDMAALKVQSGRSQQMLHVVGGQAGEPLQIWSRVAQNLLHRLQST